jgi:hypothetical protein
MDQQRGFLMLVAYMGECCTRSHCVPMRVEGLSQTEAVHRVREYANARRWDLGDVLVFMDVSEFETVEQVLGDGGKRNAEDDSH